MLGPRLGQARCRSGRSPLAVTRRLELEGAGRRAEAARELCLWSVWKPALVELSGRQAEARLAPGLPHREQRCRVPSWPKRRLRPGACVPFRRVEAFASASQFLAALGVDQPAEALGRCWRSRNAGGSLCPALENRRSRWALTSVTWPKPKACVPAESVPSAATLSSASAVL